MSPRFPAPILAAALLALGAAGAGCSGPFGDFPVTAAGLSDATWGGAAAIMGVSTASAVLTLTDDHGENHSFNVDISGPVVGVLFDVSAAPDKSGDAATDCLFQSSAQLTLPKGKALVADDVAGTYLGTEEGAHLGIGGEQHDLKNGAGVSISGGAVNLGVGVLVGFEWAGLTAK